MRDARHTGIALLLADAIAERQFQEWSMAYVGPSQSAGEAVARVTRNVSSLDDGDETKALVTFMGRVVEDGSSEVEDGSSDFAPVLAPASRVTPRTEPVPH